MSEFVQTVFIGDILNDAESGAISAREASNAMIKILEGISAVAYESIENRKQEIIESLSMLSDEVETAMGTEEELYKQFISILDEVYDWGDSRIAGATGICLFDWGWEKGVR